MKPAAELITEWHLFFSHLILIHLNVTTSAHLRDQIQINARMRAI